MSRLVSVARDMQDEPMRKILLPLIVLILAACSQQVDTSGHNIRQVWIPMADGVHLAADIYLPADTSDSDGYPVLLEYLPYRKDESREY
jgi:predicted acyl esterase